MSIAINLNADSNCISKAVDTYVDLLPFSLYANQDDHMYTITSKSVSSNTKKQNKINKTNSSILSNINKSKRFTILEWLPTSNRLNLNLKSSNTTDYVFSKNNAKNYSKKNLFKNTEIIKNYQINDLKKSNQSLHNSNNNTECNDFKIKNDDLINQNIVKNDITTYNPSLEELRKRLSDKIKLLKESKDIQKSKSKSKNISNVPFKKIQIKENNNRETQLEDKYDENLDKSIDFGSFLFTKNLADTTTKLSDRNKKGSKLKKIKSSIKRIQDEQMKIQTSVNSNDHTYIHELAFNRALQKAKGEKIHTNISKLKKVENSLKKKKERSAKRWEKRIKSKSEIKQQTDRNNIKKDNNKKISKQKSKKSLKKKKPHSNK